jgi:hypothetical protein
VLRLPRFILLLCIGLLTIGSASLHAQGTFVPPDLAYVVSGGSWERGQESGCYRVLVFSPGYEHVISKVFVEWIGDPKASNEPPRVVATEAIAAINGQPTWSVGLPSLTAAGKNAMTITLQMANTHSEEDERRTCTVRLALPHQVTATCTPP